MIALVRAFHGATGHAVGPEQVEAIRQLCLDPILGQAWVLTSKIGTLAMAWSIFVIQLTTAAVSQCLTTSGLPPISEGRVWVRGF